MSMEINVLFRGALPDKAALAQAIKELGFPITIPYARGPLDTHKGFLPMRLKRETSGVEFDVFDSRTDVEDIANGREVDPAFDRSANFRWGGDEGEMLCALCASAALARLTGGGVLGEDDEKPLSPDGAIALARQYLEDARKSKQKDERPGTRPSDIKRYLKPLLQQRSDLVLVGRRLIVRPVRHLLRGAFLDRTSDKYEFRIYPYVVPLYERIDGVGYGDYLLGAAWKTWQPHFEALLVNTLAEDIFDRVGSLTTLTDFADELSRADSIFDQRVHALVLGGARQRAKDFVRKTERLLGKAWANEQQAFLKRDIHEICAEFRAREAENVKKMKLDAAWEPSPFPAELPARQRHRVAEPPFSSAPWIATPSWLLGDVPDLPGEVRFAKGELRRKRGIVLLVPLARDIAERRHRDCESYVLAARDADGILVLLRYIGGRDTHDPQSQCRSRQDLIVEMFSAGYRIQVLLYQTPNDQAVLYFSSWTIWRRSRRFSIWNCHVGLKNGLWTVHDGRGRGERKYSEHALTDGERRLVTCPTPGFGEFEDLVPRLRAWLRHAGYGEVT